MAKNFELDYLASTGGGNPVILTQIRDAHEYKDNVKGARIGYTAVCVCPARQFSEIPVKVQDTAPTLPITQDELDARNQGGQYVYVTFSPDYKAELWKSYKDKEMHLSATASKMTIAGGSAGKEMGK